MSFNLFLSVISICFLAIIAIVSIYIYIDRLILSKNGFYNQSTFIANSFILVVSTGSSIASLMLTFPKEFGSSTLGILIIYHISAFVLTNIIITNLTYFILYADHILKLKFNFIKRGIITCPTLSYKTLTRNKRFRIFSIVFSYCVSIVIILFPIPEYLISFFKSHDVETINYISSQIEMYQKLFVFSTIPIIFSAIKSK